VVGVVIVSIVEVIAVVVNGSYCHATTKETP